MLATLVYTPVSLKLIFDGKIEDKRLHVDPNLLYRCLEKYPALQQSIFPSDPLEDKDGEAPQVELDNEWHQEEEAKGDILTGKGDTSMLQLLEETTPFNIFDIFNYDKENKEDAGELQRWDEENDELEIRPLPYVAELEGNEDPTQNSGLREGQGPEVWKDDLDVHYYLSKSRPFEAFHFMLNNPSRAFVSPLLAPYITAENVPKSFTEYPIMKRHSETGTNHASTDTEDEDLHLLEEEKSFLKRYLFFLSNASYSCSYFFLKVCSYSGDTSCIGNKRVRCLYLLLGAVWPGKL